MNGKRAKALRRIIDSVQVPNKETKELEPLPRKALWEARNVKAVPCRILLGGLFWVAWSYRTGTFSHSRATWKGAYRSLKRRFKA